MIWAVLKQQIFNEYTTFMNNLGASFATTRVSQRGLVCSVVLLVQNVLPYFELAGGTGCVAAFLYQIGQEGNNNGPASISVKTMDIEGLSQLSDRASDAFMMKCFCPPQ